MMIKVCGMRDADNIRAAEALGIDLMGFIFWPKSSRYVSEKPAYLPTQCRRVGVVVDTAIDDIRQHVEDYALDVIQLHSKETPAYLQALRSLYGDSIAIIKAFNIATAEDLQQTACYEGQADYFLFDTKAQQVGGNGTKFDWTVLASYAGETPFLLSGGIGPDDAEQVRAFHHPLLAGMDLNSRFELAPGLKDIQQLKTFIQAL